MLIAYQSLMSLFVVQIVITELLLNAAKTTRDTKVIALERRFVLLLGELLEGSLAKDHKRHES